MRRGRRVFVALSISATLSGCGGGGGGDDPAPAGLSPAQGLYSGTTSNGRTITGIVLSDGTYYVLYTSSGSNTVIGGAVQGTSSASGGTWSSGDVRDFNLEGLGVSSGTLAGTYTTKQRAGGSITYSSGTTVSFTGTYNAAYDTVPSLATIAATYSGQVAFSQGVQAATVTITSSGAITATGGGCTTTGTATPRSDGNVYDVRLSFGPSPCFFAGQTFSGIGYYDAPAKRLYAATPNPSRTDGVLFVGTRP